MSLEYPCVYYKPGGLCEKYSTDGITSYCVQGPCPDQRLSNSDRIRAMSDEELAKLLLDGCRGSKCEEQSQNKFGSVDCFQCRMDWLHGPAKEAP